MSEIKFRAWDGHTMFPVNVLAIAPVGWDCCKGRGVSLAYQPSVKVMQYTGLKDKNGKEIYKGDIIKWHGYEVENGKQIRPYRTKEIKDFIKDTYTLICLIENTGNMVEVIGNIYENLELLKE